MNAYVTRVNWKNELDRSQKDSAKSAEAANSERQKADRTREAADAVVAGFKEEIARSLHQREDAHREPRQSGPGLAGDHAEDRRRHPDPRHRRDRQHPDSAEAGRTSLQAQLDVSEKAEERRTDLRARGEELPTRCNGAQSSEESAERRRRRTRRQAAPGELTRTYGKGGVGDTAAGADKDTQARAEERAKAATSSSASGRTPGSRRARCCNSPATSRRRSSSAR